MIFSHVRTLHTYCKGHSDKASMQVYSHHQEDVVNILVILSFDLLEKTKVKYSMCITLLKRLWGHRLPLKTLLNSYENIN